MIKLKDMKETVTSHEKTEELKASNEAITFLSKIGPKDVDRCLFVDSLVIVSDTGRELGEFCVSVQRAKYNHEPCYLVHANSHGVIDNIPCGTSIMAYISKSLDTLEENHTEYIKLQEHTLEKKLHILRRDPHLLVNRVITEKDEVKKQVFTFPLHTLQGFVSEASNLLILRILAQNKKVPGNLTFLSFDIDTQISLSSYRELEEKKQVVGEEVVEVFGIERTVSAVDKNPANWQCHFLPDGHLASREHAGSSVTMTLTQLPPAACEDERVLKSVCEKKPLVWEDDIELCSRFLDRKEELIADHSLYVRQHPELKTLLADFLQMLLLRKPEDVFSFARDFFIPFDPKHPPDSTLNMSQETTVAHDKS